MGRVRLQDALDELKAFSELLVLYVELRVFDILIVQVALNYLHVLAQLSVGLE